MSIPVPIPGLPIPGFPFPGPTGTPTIFAVIPGFGPTSGGNDVLILGTNLAGATSVTFGGTPANILAQDPIGILVLVAAPAHAAGSVPVVVTNATGSSAPATYTYLGGPIGPIVAALTPTSGTVAGGTTFTIVGANLAGATVTFNGAPATSVSVNATGTVLTGVTPAGAAGTATVVVATPAGSVTVPGGFTYVAAPPPPTVSSITPTSGSVAGGTAFTIAGTGLTGATVTFNGASATGVLVSADGTVLTGVTPAGAAGTATVVVATPAGNATVPGGFTYV